MKKEAFTYSSVYQYLDALGVLETGTAEEITQARKNFRKLYVQHYQEQYNKHHTRINLWLSNEDKEQLKILAEGQDMKLPRYIKTLIHSSLEGKTPNDHIKELQDIKRLFSLSYDMAEELQHEHPTLNQLLSELISLCSQIDQLLKEL